LYGNLPDSGNHNARGMTGSKIETRHHPANSVLAADWRVITQTSEISR
jgi:3D (Asp-Asp-Asp) domain-containing protein